MIKVNATPSKEFFVYMISRDIDINYAIMELIDNSMDAGKRFQLKNSIIKISISKDEFEITDNCGGITREIARDYAFRFGRPASINNENRSDYETGVFGIGMKRALFKMGKKFSVKSNHKTGGFQVEVDVDTWMDDSKDNKSDNDDSKGDNENNKLETWDFEMTELDYNCDEEEGTIIRVWDLYKGVKEEFNSIKNLNDLKDLISFYTSEYTNKGTKIFLNKKEIEKKAITLRYDDDKGFYPYYNEMSFDNNLMIKTIAGLETKGNPKEAGWYIFCNDRLILFADKTKVTGWGSKVGRGRGIPQYHPSHAVFRGVVFMSSKDPAELPWNTTKSNLDTTSKYYSVMLDEMFDAFDEVSVAIKAIDESTSKGEDEELELLKSSKKIEISTRKVENYEWSLKSFKSPFKIGNESIKNSTTNISFKIETEKYAEVAKMFPGCSKGVIGKMLFDYYYEKEINR